jgi:5,10-methylenetetrahydrofolate reductase
MAFFRVVEVFPPLFPISGDRKPIDLEEAIDRFVKSVRNVREYSDLVLVANVKNPAYLKLSTIQAASLLQDRAGVEAAPSIVVRDANRLQLMSSVLTSIASGLRTLVLVWGDRYPSSVGATNVRDYRSLSEVIEEAARITRRAKINTRLLAPVDVPKLTTKGGVKLARSRLKGGADLLLAQPPTTDPGPTFDEHLSLLESTDLKDRVLLNVFPFRSTQDVQYCEKYFGWKLPSSLYEAASRGEASLLDEAKKVALRLRKEGLPGVYVATRGKPEVARKILG